MSMSSNKDNINCISSYLIKKRSKKTVYDDQKVSKPKTMERLNVLDALAQAVIVAKMAAYFAHLYVDDRDGSYFYCGICQKSGTLIRCDTSGCPRAYHLECVQLTTVPLCEWHCYYCTMFGREQSLAMEPAKNRYTRAQHVMNAECAVRTGGLELQHLNQDREDAMEDIDNISKDDMVCSHESECETEAEDGSIIGSICVCGQSNCAECMARGKW